MLHKGFIPIIICLFSIFSLQAQDYATGLGFRMGFSQGITVKHFFKSDVSIEGLLGTRWRGYIITGLVEKHFPLAEVNGLKWFVGGGGHFGIWSNRYSHPHVEKELAYTNFGVDGIIGVEYTFNKAPLNLALDWKPEFQLVNPSGFYGDSAAFSIRYAFK